MVYLGQILHTYLKHFLAYVLQNNEEASSTTILAGQGLLVNSLTAWYIFIKICIIIHCLDTGIQNVFRS